MTITIDDVQTDQTFGDPVQSAPRDVPLVRVIYHDGFVKHHEATDVPSLVGKITNTLKGRYGVSAFNILTMPGALEAGDIKLENVTYGV